MTESVWLPGLVVLGLGLLIGAVVAWRLRRGAAGTSDADRELRIADLAARRDDLYDRLRSAHARDDTAEVERLETSAARTLRSLDELGSLKADAVGAAAERPGDRGSVSAATGGWVSRHPLTTGFLFGAGMVSLVGLLIYWAVQDAGPRPEMAAPTPRPPEAPQHDGAELPPEVAARVAELETTIAATPQDLQSRRELALLRLQASQYVEAFQQAEAILAVEPNDIDALYVQGVVRLTMGQVDVAKERFDQVLALYPQHVRALVARGAIFFQSGDRDGAIADWQAGLDASGGSQPEIEGLLARARAVPDSAVPTRPPAAAAAPAAAADSPEFDLRVSYAGAVPAGAVLFVSLRGDAPGPPAAVRRIDRPTFPLEITLGTADSMLGRPLPESGMLAVRLDGDGSASTKEPTEPSAEASIAAGQSIELVLQ